MIIYMFVYCGFKIETYCVMQFFLQYKIQKNSDNYYSFTSGNSNINNIH
jgi:hypothetical protein